MIKTDLDTFEAFRETNEQNFLILKDKPNIQLNLLYQNPDKCKNRAL